METHSETAVAELDKIAFDITVNGEEKRLIELFRGFNILGKANVMEVINAFCCLNKFTDMGINLYEKRSVQQ